MNNPSPKLIENQAGHYLFQTLKQCHEKRVVTYSFMWNVAIVSVFLLVAGLILVLLFRKKQTPDEQREKIIHDQKFILEKIKSLKEQKQYYLENDSITKMPIGEPDPHAKMFY